MADKPASPNPPDSASQIADLLVRLRRREEAKASVVRAREIAKLESDAHNQTRKTLRRQAEQILGHLPRGITCDTNPYLEKFHQLPHVDSELHVYLREVLVDHYSWAIPNEAALATITRYQPIIEIGAGTGYWAAMLRARGVDVLAVDSTPVESGLNHSYTQAAHSFTDIINTDETVVMNYPDRTLFICWPPDFSPMACSALCHYTGKHFILIGESDNSGQAELHSRLEQQWQLVDSADIPQWGGMHDWLQVYERKTSSTI